MQRRRLVVDLGLRGGARGVTGFVHQDHELLGPRATRWAGADSHRPIIDHVELSHAREA
ncbi:hypothetical protein GCM10028781_08600 [Nostocoides australiense]